MEITPTITQREITTPPPSFGGDGLSRGRLNIWHVGASASPHSVNGVNIAIWRIATAQAAAGHGVHLPILTDPGETHTGAGGVTRHVVPTGRLLFRWSSLHRLLKASKPDIVHIHSAFIPRHTFLGRFLRKEGIPYVVTPHGGLLPQVLSRDRIKKSAYSFLFEKPFIRGARGVTGVTPRELDYVRAFGEPSAPRGRCILNPIPPDTEIPRDGFSGSERPFILFLGRFDTVTKGLDRLIEIARRVPEADFHLYGRSHSKRDDEVLKTAPANVVIHAPVFGAEKADVLRRTTIYLQPSRWEAFSISVAEALGAGIPCVLTETLHQAELLASEGAAFPIPEDPADAAARLQLLLADPQALLELSMRGRTFARERLAADRVADAYVDFYRELLGHFEAAPADLQQPSVRTHEISPASATNISRPEVK